VVEVKRILFLALFFVSAVDFAMEHAPIDLVFMILAVAILLWERLGVLR
jgi:hypothetical protein